MIDKNSELTLNTLNNLINTSLSTNDMNVDLKSKIKLKNQDIVSTFENNQVLSLRNARDLLKSYNVIEVTNNFDGDLELLFQTYGYGDKIQNSHNISLVLIGGGSNTVMQEPIRHHTYAVPYSYKCTLATGEVKFLPNLLINKKDKVKIEIGRGGQEISEQESNIEISPGTYSPGQPTRFNNYIAKGGNINYPSSGNIIVSDKVDNLYNINNPLNYSTNFINYTPHNFLSAGCVSSVFKYLDKADDNRRIEWIINSLKQENISQLFLKHPRLWDDNTQLDYDRINTSVTSKTIITPYYVGNLSDLLKSSGGGKDHNHCIPKICGKDAFGYGNSGNPGCFFYGWNRSSQSYYYYRGRSGKGGQGVCYIYF